MPSSAAKEALAALKLKLARRIRFVYEHAALDCGRCQNAVCCTDAHFVNVHITRLEAELIQERLEQLGPEVRAAALARAAAVVEQYQLSDAGDTYLQTYSCPLYQKGAGCLVHGGGGKPAPCVHHACYERREDVPPASLLADAEAEIEGLNREAYAEEPRWRPLPLWLTKG
ncbi:MAG: hypothetical protein U1E65_27775 [Myxococcota bacterium]